MRDEPEDKIERQLEERLATKGVKGFILVPTAEAQPVEHHRQMCIVHTLPEPCPTCRSYIAAGL